MAAAAKRGVAGRRNIGMAKYGNSNSENLLRAAIEEKRNHQAANSSMAVKMAKNIRSEKAASTRQLSTALAATA